MLTLCSSYTGWSSVLIFLSWIASKPVTQTQVTSGSKHWGSANYSKQLRPGMYFHTGMHLEQVRFHQNVMILGLGTCFLNKRSGPRTSVGPVSLRVEVVLKL